MRKTVEVSSQRQELSALISFTLIFSCICMIFIAEVLVVLIWSLSLTHFPSPSSDRAGFKNTV